MIAVGFFGYFRGYRALRSLALALIIGTFWARSYFVADIFRKGTETRYEQYASAAGSAIITLRRDLPTYGNRFQQQPRITGRWEYSSRSRPREMLLDAGMGDSVWSKLGFGDHREMVYDPARSVIVNLMLPHWLLFLIFIPRFAWWYFRQQRELKANEGYDQRAMYACPGCGQLYARVPPVCAVCRQEMVQPEAY
jgi:hypothetical protein